MREKNLVPSTVSKTNEWLFKQNSLFHDATANSWRLTNNVLVYATNMAAGFEKGILFVLFLKANNGFGFLELRVFLFRFPNLKLWNVFLGGQFI